jgi:RND family efflux transporter MFP subunit
LCFAGAFQIVYCLVHFFAFFVVEKTQMRAIDRLKPLTLMAVGLAGLCPLITAGAGAAPLSVQGITEPLRQAVISAEFAGRVITIRKDEGSFAKKGDTIMEMDYKETQLDAERCRIIAENKAELAAAKLKSETAKLDYDATKVVHDSTRAISDEELWKKELDYNLAKNECERLSMTKEKEVLDYRISLERLKHYFVIAPFDGVVAQRFLNEAESCKPQEQLIKFVDVHKCRFITYVPGDRSQGLAKGKRVTISLGGAKAPRTRQGSIEFVSPVVDASSGLRTVKAVFDNADGSIQPGVAGAMLIDEQ